MSLITQADAKEIETAIEHAEAHSAGEIVVAVLPRADSYDLYRGIAAAGWTLATMLLVQRSGEFMPVWWLLLAQVPVGVVWWYVFGTTRFLRMVLPHQTASRAVRARALRLFAEHGVHRTRDRSGLLIVVSELEHRVEILGDDGIHAHIGTAGWENHARTLIGGIRGGRTKAALLQVIKEFSAVLEARFPRRADDTNELPNEVIRG